VRHESLRAEGGSSRKSSKRVQTGEPVLRCATGCAVLLTGSGPARNVNVPQTFRVGGAGVTVGALRVMFWGALAMAITAGVGRCSEQRLETPDIFLEKLTAGCRVTKYGRSTGEPPATERPLLLAGEQLAQRRLNCATGSRSQLT